MLTKFQAGQRLVFGVSLLLSITAIAAPNNWQLNMHRGVTPLSHEMYKLHMIAMIVCAMIGVIVFGVMIYSLIYHRKSQGQIPATFHSNARLEVLWSVIPFLILVGLAIPATKVLMRMEDSSESDLTIKVTGSQWKWQYQYLDQGISFISYLSTPYNQILNKEKKAAWYLLEVDKPLVLPVNKKVRFLVTSNDVIHSWWVPELGVKRDAIPGFIHESWAIIEKPGTYRGQCTELCGINHAFMPIVVKAVSQDKFNQWVEKQPKTMQLESQVTRPLPVLAKTKASPAPLEKRQNPQNPPVVSSQNQATQAVSAPSTLSQDELMTLGKAKYEQVCLACHQENGLGIPPMYPALRGSSIAVGRPISRHIDVILYGVPGSAMQAYQHQLTDADIAAIVTYERNAWGNNTGDFIQPNDVMLEREKNSQTPKLVNKAKAGGMR